MRVKGHPGRIDLPAPRAAVSERCGWASPPEPGRRPSGVRCRLLLGWWTGDSCGSGGGARPVACPARYRVGMVDALSPGPLALAILKSTDIERTIAWYQTIGFELRGQHPDVAPAWCEVECNGTVLQFLAGSTPWEGEPAFTGCFYVHATDVDAVHQQVRELVDVPWGVEDRDWGARELVLRDPDGYFITFTQPAECVMQP